MKPKENLVNESTCETEDLVVALYPISMQEVFCSFCPNYFLFLRLILFLKGIVFRKMQRGIGLCRKLFDIDC